MAISKQARILWGIAAAVFLIGAAGAASGKSLSAFKSDAELKAFLQRSIAKRTPPPPAPPPPPAAADSAVQSVVVTAAKAAASEPGITNVQTQGVDEGDIVKRHGDLLIVLHRGRLFTMSIAKGGMRAVDSINAYPPDVDARADWYDEMLVSGNNIAVVGYSYGRGGTEVNRFRIDETGHLRYRDSWQLRSNDYYSARNYASRLIGTKLILYAPLYLPWNASEMLDALPAYRRWRGNDKSPFQRIAGARHIYYSPLLHDTGIEAIHSVTTCDLAADDMGCKATSVLGPDGRTFYVSATAVYVWATQDWYGDRHKVPSGILYRLPLDGSAPSAVGVRGGPTDQFSFREDGDVLNVLVRSQGGGDAMWRSEFSDGKVALLRVPMSAFGDGTYQMPWQRYRLLPQPQGNAWEFQNRFVGDYVLYGVGNSWGTPDASKSSITVVPVRGGAVTVLHPGHSVDRIDLMGRDAVVIGGDAKNLYFSAIELTPERMPKLGDRYTMADASQSETRSHGFFFKPEADPRDGSMTGAYGVIGLPVAHAATPGYAQLFQDSAGMFYLRRTAGRFGALGELASHPEGAVDDGCVASCVDWYGNARPIFIGDRAFALMGYELVEGRIGDKSVTEVGRLNFAPAAKPEPARARN